MLILRYNTKYLTVKANLLKKGFENLFKQNAGVRIIVMHGFP